MYRRMAAAIEIYVYKHFFCHSIFLQKNNMKKKKKKRELVFLLYLKASFPLFSIYPVIQFSVQHIIHGSILKANCE